MSRHAPHSVTRSADGKTVTSAVDWLGNTFCVGDKVLYCISAGRGQMMALGTVLKIMCEQKIFAEYEETDDEQPDWVNDFWDPPRKFNITRKPYDEVTVQVHTLKTSGRWDNQQRTKPAWVNPMNVTSLRNVGAA